jgi:hypothetical protein
VEKQTPPPAIVALSSGGELLSGQLAVEWWATIRPGLVEGINNLTSPSSQFNHSWQILVRNPGETRRTVGILKRNK